MSTVLPTRQMQVSSLLSPAPSDPPKPTRVLACVLCQRRKVKCDRKYPCGNCVKSQAQCVSAALVARRRKRRFPERELLDRIRHYEDLLRRHKIKFEPLHGDTVAENGSPNPGAGPDSDDEHARVAATDALTPSTNTSPVRSSENRTIQHATNQAYHRRHSESESSDGEEEVLVKKVWNQLGDVDDHLWFGFHSTGVDTAQLHPTPVHIFRLWQIYLQNVDPLLKITHAPTLQGSIVEAAEDVSNIKPPLEALMFGIYSMAVFSLETDECQAIFATSKSDLLTNYWSGCQQALLKCHFLRTRDRDCLTALCLYLISLRHSTMPQSMSTMLGMAVRIAQRMGLHSESALAKCTAFEAEMRRRLWWALVLHDARMGELADSGSPILTPLWDCRIPLSVNDTDLRLTAKEIPDTEGRCTEALFAVVRSAMGNVIRHTMFNLFASPGIRHVARDLHNSTLPDCEELDELEKTIEEKYLRFCDLDEPLQFMTVWTTRSTLAKCRILEHNFRFSSTSPHQPDAQRDVAISYCLRMLECDTQLQSSPLTKGFLWLVHFYFPMFAYIQIVQILKRHPSSRYAEQAWTVMGENYEARFGSLKEDDIPFVYPFFKVFTEIMFQAWETRATTLRSSSAALETPRIVSLIRDKLAQIAPYVQHGDAGTVDSAALKSTWTPGPIPMGFGGHAMTPPTQPQPQFSTMGSGVFPGMPVLAQLDIDLNQFDWGSMDWTTGPPSFGDVSDFSNPLPPF